MGQVIVQDISDIMIASLSQIAARHDHTLEQEVRMILSNAVHVERKTLLEEAKKIASMSPSLSQASPSSEFLIREDRDERGEFRR